MTTRTLRMRKATLARKLKEQELARKAGIHLRWYHTRDMPGSGTKTRLACEKGATEELHLMSEAEHAAFLDAWWRRDVVTIYDQNALDTEKTQRAAVSIGIEHPRYDGRGVPAVLSTDLVLNVKTVNSYGREAVSVKSVRSGGTASLTRSQEIERKTWENEGATYRAVTVNGMHTNRSKNLGWIFRAHNDTVGRQLSDAELVAQREVLRIFRARKDVRVIDACNYIDRAHGLPTGSGVQAFRQLAGCKSLAFDLNVSDPVVLKFDQIWRPRQKI
ncbi:UNVERIFIED_ORG: TnsA endonuclease-like protein [Burkholderia sp. CF145]|uniref:heteromeric transposase endonuclease subunit TnsA n=1 Tax=Paraburkholderia hospita TaxID=169430 RepID=UPI0002719C44|nr:heteromeric transposase endonuclease subunit TnsA [Paraburkholderia hospita]EUC18708.1 TnsA endonuclease [Burkholderia sp. BT03]SKC62312.1 TnsA endonuclease C terminal [Paraburkholderia hospita]